MKRSVSSFSAALIVWALAGMPVFASTQDTQPAAPAAKSTTSATPAAAAKKAPATKKDATKKAAPTAAKQNAKPQAAAGTCEPTRTFVPANKDQAVCTPANPEAQKFNTFEDIYVPPAPVDDDKK